MSIEFNPTSISDTQKVIDVNIAGLVGSKYDWALKQEQVRMEQARVRDVVCSGSSVEIEDLIMSIFRKYFHTKNNKLYFIPVSRTLRNIVTRKAAMVISENTSYSLVKKNGEVDEEISGKYKKFLFKINYFNKFRQALQIAKYQNISGIYPMKTRTRWEKDEISLLILSPASFIVKPFDDNYLEPEVVSYCYEDEKKRVVWKIESNETIKEVFPNGSIKNDEIENPYGVLRWVFLRLENGEDFYGSGRFDDLVTGAALEMAGLASSFNALMFQSFGLMVVKNYDRGELPVSPDEAIQFRDIEPGQESGVEFVRQGADYSGALDFITRYAKKIAIDNGLPRSVAGIDAGGASSGYQEYLEGKSLREDRIETIPPVRKAETEMFYVFRAMSNKDEELFGFKIPLDYDIAIDYAEPSVEKTEAEELDVIERKIKMNIANPIDYLLKQNPDFQGDRKKAEEFYTSCKAINNKFSFVSPFSTGKEGE